MNTEIREMISKAADRVIKKVRFYNLFGSGKSLAELDAMGNLLACMDIDVDFEWASETRIASLTLSYGDYCVTVYA